MSIRINMTKSKVEQEILLYAQAFNINISSNIINYNISQNIIDLCLQNLFLQIDMWNGVNLTKTTSKASHQIFRKYFSVAKNWWDQRKTIILGNLFWSKVFINIKQYLINLLNKQHIQSALLQVLSCHSSVFTYLFYITYILQNKYIDQIKKTNK